MPVWYDSWKCLPSYTLYTQFNHGSMNEHRAATNIAICENSVMQLVNWFVGWLDSGAPTLVIGHHSLILSLSGPELNKDEQ